MGNRYDEEVKKGNVPEGRTPSREEFEEAVYQAWLDAVPFRRKNIEGEPKTVGSGMLSKLERRAEELNRKWWEKKRKENDASS